MGMGPLTACKKFEQALAAYPRQGIGLSLSSLSITNSALHCTRDGAYAGPFPLAFSRIFIFIVGVPLLIPSILGIIAGAKRHFGVNVTYLVLVILSLIYTFGVSVILAGGTLIISRIRSNPHTLRGLESAVSPECGGKPYGTEHTFWYGMYVDVDGSGVGGSVGVGEMEVNINQGEISTLDHTLDTVFYSLAACTCVSFLTWVLQLAGSIITCVSLCTVRHSSYGTPGTSMEVTTHYAPAAADGYNQPVPGVIIPLPQYAPMGDQGYGSKA